MIGVKLEEVIFRILITMEEKEEIKLIREKSLVKNGGKEVKDINKVMSIKHLFFGIITLSVLACRNRGYEPIFEVMEEIENSWDANYIQDFKNLTDTISVNVHF